jgi:hypothetical protein
LIQDDANFRDRLQMKMAPHPRRHFSFQRSR